MTWTKVLHPTWNCPILWSGIIRNSRFFFSKLHKLKLGWSYHKLSLSIVAFLLTTGAADNIFFNTSNLKKIFQRLCQAARNAWNQSRKCRHLLHFDPESCPMNLSTDWTCLTSHDSTHPYLRRNGDNHHLENAISRIIQNDPWVLPKQNWQWRMAGYHWVQTDSQACKTWTESTLETKAAVALLVFCC